jgi:hypothetical protein
MPYFKKVVVALPCSVEQLLEACKKKAPIKLDLTPASLGVKEVEIEYIWLGNRGSQQVEFWGKCEVVRRDGLIRIRPLDQGRAEISLR